MRRIRFIGWVMLLSVVWLSLSGCGAVVMGALGAASGAGVMWTVHEQEKSRDQHTTVDPSQPRGSIDAQPHRAR